MRKVGQGLPDGVPDFLALVGAFFVALYSFVGHSLHNYALGFVKIDTANLLSLLEPVIASLFAVVLFSEIPALIQLAGYSLI